LIRVISYTFVDGFTRVARVEAIERLKRSIARADGVILDFAFFGGEAIRLTVEMDAAALVAFREALSESEIELFPRSAADLDAAQRMEPTHPIFALLHVSFVSAEDERDLAASAPAG
jgi:hypothetical protein